MQAARNVRACAISTTLRLTLGLAREIITQSLMGDCHVQPAE